MKNNIKNLLINDIPDNIDNVVYFELTDRINRACDEFHTKYCEAMGNFEYFCDENRIPIEDRKKVYFNSKFPNYVRHLKCKLSEEFSKCNEIFRNFIGVKPNAKKYSIYTLSFGKEKVTDYIKWNYFDNFQKKKYGPRPQFSQRYVADFIDGMFSILYKKYNGRIYEFRFRATLYKIIIDFFDIDMCSQFNFDLAIQTAYNHMVEEQITITKEPRKKRKDSANYPTTQEYLKKKEEGWGNKEIQEFYAKQLHVSTRSVRNDMSLKGITDKKFITKKNIKTEQ